MEESLKSARLLYRMLMIGSVTLLLFAASSPFNQSEYHMALKELRSIYIGIEELEKPQKEIIDSFYRENPLILFLKKELGSILSEDFHLRFLPEFPKGYKRSLKEIRDLIDYRSTIVHGKGYIYWTRYRQGSVLLPDFDDKSLITMKEQSKDSNVKEEDFLNNPIRFFRIRFPSGIIPDTQQVEMRFEIVTDYATIGAYQGTFEVSLVHVDLPKLNEFELSTKLFKLGLISENSREGMALPRLSHPNIWINIKDFSYDEAEAFLVSEVEKFNRENQDNLSLFGITIESKIAIFGGPLALIFLMIYLYAHLKHIESIIVSDKEAILMFPWFPLFEGWWESISSYLFVIILPATASFCIVQIADTGPLPKNYLQISYVIFNITLGILVCVRLYRIKKFKKKALLN